MSDILLYNAFNENQKLLLSYFGQGPTPTRDIITSAASGYGCTLQTNLGIVLPKLVGGFSGCIKVWDGTIQYCGGAAGTCCLWTVPSGVTEAEFLIWGAGSTGNAPNTCCTVGSHGGDGAYAYVRMQVTAAQTYTLCAGGACSSGGLYGNYLCDGCNSFVCGSNNTCIIVCGAPVRDCYYPGLISNGVAPIGVNYYYNCFAAYNKETMASVCAGNMSTSNEVLNCSAIRARKGGWYYNIAGGCCVTHAISATHVNDDHTLTRCYYGSFCDGYEPILIGYYGTGCYNKACCFDRGPGRGGAGARFQAQCVPGYGDSGNSGQIIVRYR